MNFNQDREDSFTIKNAEINQSLLDAIIEISAATAQFGVSAEDAGIALRKIAQALSKEGKDLLRPETLDTTENSNQNGLFDFLEQNAYDEINTEWITPLDTI